MGARPSRSDGRTTLDTRCLDLATWPERWKIEPNDIAIAKLCAAREKDMEWLREALRHNIIEASVQALSDSFEYRLMKK